MAEIVASEGIRPRKKGPIIAEMKRREALHKEKSLERWLASVPHTHHGFDVQNIKEGWGGKLGRAEIVQVLRYIESGGSRYMLLQGPEGVGKSTLAVTVFSELVKKTGKQAKHYVVPQLLSMFSHPRDKEDPLGDASKVPYLLLDDMGAGNGGMTDHQQRSLWALIDARWSNPELRTIITTNMSQNDQREGVGLRSWLGTAAWARVADDLTQVAIRGESFRGRSGIDDEDDAPPPVERVSRERRSEPPVELKRGFSNRLSDSRRSRRD